MAFPRLVESSPRSSPLSERTDDELMTLSQAGVREAFAVLVERHTLGIVRVCARFTGDPALGAELAQQTWVTIWERREQYRPQGNFFLWVLTLARNRCRNHTRSAAVAERYARRSVAPTSTPEPDQIDLLLLEERRRQVRVALAKLAAPLREALILRYGEELRYDAMVQVTRVGESTLRSRVHHGLKTLRRLLEVRS